jgi:hypothetical protein
MITFTLSETDAQSVVNAVAKRPYEEVHALVQNLLQQAQAQVQGQAGLAAAPEAPADEKPASGQQAGSQRVRANGPAPVA